MAWSLNHQADVAREQGDASTAQSLYGQALEIFRGLDNRRGIARSLVDLGSLARELGDHAAAQTLCAEALALFKELALRFELVAVLEEIAASASDGGDWDRALRLGGAALTLRQAAGIRRSASTKVKLERSLQVAREQLESGLAARAWMEGSRMSLEQAIEYAQARDTG
jgi:tetratricopeptide (TPR) repeat protein